MKEYAFFAVLSVCAIAAPPQSKAQSNDGVKFGLGIAAGSLGAGVQGAVSVTGRSDVRAGFNFFQYNDTFSKDGVQYSGRLKLMSAQVTFDQYLWKGIHLSPGLLIYNGNKGTATANVSAGQSFSLGNTAYYSGAANPVSGSGRLTFNKVAPMILLGFGNLVPRSRHFAVNFDVGAAYQGTPKTALNLTGNACGISATVGCLNAGTDPTVQSNVTAEQTKINNSLNPFRFYPIVSLTVGYRF